MKLELRKDTSLTPTRQTLGRMWDAHMETDLKMRFGRRLNSCLMLLRAMYEIADRVNDYTFSAANSELLKLSGISSKATLTGARQLLVEEGFVSREEPDGGVNRYQLQWGATIKVEEFAKVYQSRSDTHEKNYEKGTVLRKAALSPADDSFTGIPSTWRVYLAIHSFKAPPKAQQIAELVQLHPSSVYRHLRRLRDWGLVVRNDDATFSVTDVDPQELPEIRDTRGYTEYRHQQIDKEREEYQDWQESGVPRFRAWKHGVRVDKETGELVYPWENPSRMTIEEANAFFEQGDTEHAAV